MTDDGRLRVGVSGALGRMGSMTCAAVQQDPDLVLSVAVDPRMRPDMSEALAGVRCYTELANALADGGLDVLVDFTVPAAVRENVLTSLSHRIPVVVGTTGLSTEDLSDIATASREATTPVLVAPNFAMGAVLMMKAARLAAEHLRACEIVELHHERKLDAPSGTSKLTRTLIAETWRAAGFERDIPIHSVRLPGLVAHQEVIFGGVGETLTIRHDSLSRESFMPGVLLAIKRIRSLQGLVVGLENLL